MDIKYKREPESCQMIITCTDEKNGYKDKMVFNNRIECLLDFSRSEMGSETEYWYDILGKKSIEGYFIQEGISARSIHECLNAINESLKSIRKYLLNTSDIAFSEETIFMEFNGFKWKSYFAYFPCHDFDFNKSMEKLAEFLIANVNHEDEKATKICYEIYERVIAKDVTIQNLIDLVQKYETEALVFQDQESTEPEPIDYIKKLEECPLDDDLFIIDEPKKKRSIFRLFRKRKERKEKEEKIFEKDSFSCEPEYYAPIIEDSATTILSADDSPIYRSLIYEGRGGKQNIFIDKTPFRIGSKTEVNDAVINESVISRAHAEITIEEERYYIKDLESKNGTFVNGTMLAFNKRLELFAGDRISFANIGYRFE